MQTALARPRSDLGSVRRRQPALDMPRIAVKGEAIFNKGGPAEFLYQVLSGAVRTSQLLHDGRRQIDAFHLPGDIFGIETAEAHRFSAEAIETSTILAYPRRRLDGLALDASGVSQLILSAVMRSLERARAHMLLLGRKSAVEKIATFLLDLSERLSGTGRIDLPMTRADIADHLGLTIETVSRTLTQLEREGVIELPAHRRCIILRDRSILQRLDA